MATMASLSLLLVGCGPKTAPPSPVHSGGEAEQASTSMAQKDAPAHGEHKGHDHWRPIDASSPDGPQLALLSGNPESGPFSALVRLPGGHASELHSHPATMHAVVISGIVANGRTPEEAVKVEAGGTWMQAGNEVHFTGCLSADGCVFVGTMDGAMGSTVAEAPAEVSTQRVTAAEAIEFVPVNPAQPKGPSVYPLSGDRAKGPFTALANFPPGFATPPHSHTAGSAAALVSGNLMLSSGSTMVVGDHWTTDGGVVHQATCTSEEPCRFFITMDGALDMVPAK